MPLPPSLDIKTLGYLVTLLETRSVSAAAEKIGVSQPAASRVLARLRDQLQDPLLVRGRGGMALSAYAQTILDPLKRWLDAGEAVLRPLDFDPSTTKRELRVGSTDFGVISVLTGVMPNLMKEAPGLAIRIERLTGESLRDLAAGKLDLVIIGGTHEEPGVDFHPLFTEHHVGVIRANHPACDRLMDVDEFLRWPHIIPVIDGFGDLFRGELEMRTERYVAMSIPSFSAIPYVIEKSDAIGLLPSRAASVFCATHNLVHFESPIPSQSFGYFIASHQRSTADAAAQWVLNTIINLVR